MRMLKYLLFVLGKSLWAKGHHSPVLERQRGSCQLSEIMHPWPVCDKCREEPRVLFNT